jgi:hypothetical protein
LLLGRVSGQRSHLAHAKRAALALFAAPPARGYARGAKTRAPIQEK